MKHNQNFDDFLKNHVNLNQSRINALDERVNSITNLLRLNLFGYRKISKQGSYAHGTIIKPVKDYNEFDADILVFIKDDNFDPNYFQEDYVKRIFDVFINNGNYKDKVKLNTRCCTIDYAGEVHIDIVPCIEHGNSKFICNRSDYIYERTDGDGYSSWLIQKNQIVRGNYLRKVIRLNKFLRDHKSNFSIPSILLTTILAYMVREQDNYSKEFSDLAESLKTLSNRVNNWLQYNPTMPIINNPALNEENFNRNWEENKYRNFRDKFNIYTKKINEAYYETDNYKSLKKWRELFGDEFGELQKLSSVKEIAGVAGLATTIKSPRVVAQKPYLSSIQTNSSVFSNYNYDTSEMQRINRYFPDLYHENNVIKGYISFSAMYQLTKRHTKNKWEIVPCDSGKRCIRDSYKIEIHLDKVQFGCPKVFEVGGRIKNLACKLNKPVEDLHIYTNDYSCCLGIFPEKSNESLSAFVINKVYPYFVWQAYFEKFSEIPPVGEYSHGIQGLREYLEGKNKVITSRS